MFNSYYERSNFANPFFSFKSKGFSSEKKTKVLNIFNKDF